MRIKIEKTTFHAITAYSVFYKVWYLPFWRQFLYGVNEGGGQYFIFERTKESALSKYQKAIEVIDSTNSTGETNEN